MREVEKEREENKDEGDKSNKKSFPATTTKLTSNNQRGEM